RRRSSCPGGRTACTASASTTSTTGCSSTRAGWTWRPPSWTTSRSRAIRATTSPIGTCRSGGSARPAAATMPRTGRRDSSISSASTSPISRRSAGIRTGSPCAPARSCGLCSSATAGWSNRPATIASAASPTATGPSRAATCRCPGWRASSSRGWTPRDGAGATLTTSTAPTASSPGWPNRSRTEGVDPRTRRSSFGPMLHPYATTAVERASEVLARLDLTRPGAMAGWLNEPIPGTAKPRPLITRLALLLYKVRPDVQRDYPDPLEVHQADLAYWFCRYAAHEFRLHPSLVAPVLRTLPWRTRLPLSLRPGEAAVGAAAPLPAEPSSNGHDDLPPEVAAALIAESPAGEPHGSSARGVNLAGYFGMDTGVGQIARGSLSALRKAGLPAIEIRLDQELQSRMLDGRLQLEEGAPHPVTLIHANADETPRALSLLPLAGTAGGFKIGYWFWELSHFPLFLTDRFGHLDEVWAPSRFCQRSFEAVATIPVRYVPPCVPAPSARPLERAAFGLEDGRFAFLFAFDVLSIPERKNPFAAIEAVRLLTRRTSRPFSLLIKVTRARAEPNLVERLRQAARGLPISIHTAPASRDEMDSLVGLCDANLSLHRSEGLGLLPIETLYLGKPVVATGYGGVTDFLDEETGFPVGYELVRLERDYSPYPVGAVWAEPNVEHAAERMLAILEHPDEAAERAERGRRRVEELYGLASAAQRFTAEVERVYGELHSGHRPPTHA